MQAHTRTVERYARGVAAAVAAVAALVLASVTGPTSDTAQPDPDQQTTAPVEAAVR
ncbi:hypothetical protein [Streptomyces sp. bgisy022]|uniref:hypothetical protein n=1 Tax=Streptomyces sp. bgisy022 TaxID=3413769 RepID=UPI003D75504B